MQALNAVLGALMVLQFEAQAAEPLEECVALRVFPGIYVIVVGSILNIENLAVPAQLVVGNTVAGPGVLHAIDEHHFAFRLLDAVEHLTNVSSFVVSDAIRGVIVYNDGRFLLIRQQVVDPSCRINNRA